MIVWSFITENTGEQSGSSLMSFWQLGDHEEADADTGNSRATSPSQTTEPTYIVFIHTHKHSGMPRHELGKVSSTSTALGWMWVCQNPHHNSSSLPLARVKLAAAVSVCC